MFIWEMYGEQASVWMYDCKLLKKLSRFQSKFENVWLNQSQSHKCNLDQDNLNSMFSSELLSKSVQDELENQFFVCFSIRKRGCKMTLHRTEYMILPGNRINQITDLSSFSKKKNCINLIVLMEFSGIYIFHLRVTVISKI